MLRSVFLYFVVVVVDLITSFILWECLFILRDTESQKYKFRENQIVSVKEFDVIVKLSGHVYDSIN